VWGNPELTAQFSVWNTIWKDSSEACAIACQNWAAYSVFPSCMTPHSKIAQFNWKCTIYGASDVNHAFVHVVVTSSNAAYSVLMYALCYFSKRLKSLKNEHQKPCKTRNRKERIWKIRVLLIGTEVPIRTIRKIQNLWRQTEPKPFLGTALALPSQ
jgi:hypothetical protein